MEKYCLQYHPTSVSRQVVLYVGYIIKKCASHGKSPCIHTYLVDYLYDVSNQ